MPRFLQSMVVDGKSNARKGHDFIHADMNDPVRYYSHHVPPALNPRG